MEFACHRAPEVPLVPIHSSEGAANMNLNNVVLDGPKTTPFERRFNPYDFNGGTTVCIAGADYAIAAGCTRMSTGYEIISRTQSKLTELTGKSVLAAAGCMTDIVTLRKMLGARLTQYEQSNGKDMSCDATAQLLSVTLYYRRFFPYYAFCMIAGLDEEGKGAVYGYDAVGSFQRDIYGAMGSGQNFIMPILDNVVAHKHRLDPKIPLTVDEAIAIVKEVFIVATERDIHTGDNIEIKVITKAGIQTVNFPLKTD